MSNTSHPPFKIGQQVVCVKPSGGLVKDTSYRVSSLEECKKCKVWYVGVDDIKLDIPIVPGCAKCSSTLKYPNLAMWRSFRFAPIKKLYADATAKILEQFPITEEIPDKILKPEKVNS